MTMHAPSSDSHSTDTNTTAGRRHFGGFDSPLGMGDRLHMHRSRGATTGVLLLLLGLWGGLVPFAGPLFGYAYTPDEAWTLTWARFWLEILPAAAVVVGALLVLASANRLTGWLGGWLAAAGGVWFVIGQPISMLWNDGAPAAGSPASASTLGQVAEQIGFFTGLGVVIVFLAAAALGRMSVVGVRDLADRYEEPPDGGHARR